MAVSRKISSAQPRRTALDAFAWVFTVSLLAAGLEVAAVAFLRLRGQDFLFVPRGAAWMVTTFHVAAVSAIGILLVIGGRRWPVLRQPRVIHWCAGAWASSGALLTFHPRLHLAAIVIASCGAGVAAVRLAGSARGRRASLVAACLAVPMIAGATLHGWRAGRSAPAAATARPELPNVVLMFLDTVRGDHLGVMGYHRPTTPVLDALAGRGVVFERAVAPAPWTLPSHASALTGRWPLELSADWRTALDGAPATLAASMQQAGYQTAGFVANTRYVSYESGLSRGFGHYEGYATNAGRIFLTSAVGRLLTSSARLRGLIGWEWSLDRRLAADVREGFEDWVRHSDARRPFFAFLNFFDAHHPYEPPAGIAGHFGGVRNERSLGRRFRSVLKPEPLFLEDSAGLEAMQRSYDESLRYLDGEIGKLLEGLRAMGRLENTIVIVTADHGEHFGEHGLVDHGNSLYYPLLHVPLIIASGDSVVPRGVRVAQPVSLRDIPATIADLARVVPRADLPGTSLRRAWEGGSSSPALAVVTGITEKPSIEPISRGDMAALLVDSLLVIRDGDCHYELFNVDRDPSNVHDLAAREPFVAQSLSRLVDSLAPYDSAAPEASHACGRLRRSHAERGPSVARAPVAVSR